MSFDPPEAHQCASVQGEQVHAGEQIQIQIQMQIQIEEKNNTNHLFPKN